MEGDVVTVEVFPFVLHFNPLPPYGGRHSAESARNSQPAFQSTPSVWRETSRCFKSSSSFKFQSTPSVWRETFPGIAFCRSEGISIHSLRMEGDLLTSSNLPSMMHFNPLPPYGGRRLQFFRCHTLQRHFNPLPPYGGRP